MKLLRYGPRGGELPGALDGEGRVRSLGGVVEDIDPRTLNEDLRFLKGVDLRQLEVVEEGVRIGPPITGVGKIVGIGLNYMEHARETGKTPPAEPYVFLKAPTAMNGPYDPILIPPGGEKLDWEVELAVVIGKKATCVSKENTADHIAGYCLINDVSERGFQKERAGGTTKGKSFDTFAPLGPWLVTGDEIPNRNGIDLWTEVNGTVKQRSNTSDMIFDVPTLLSYVSGFMTLSPGDVVATGTPAGVGQGVNPTQFLRDGDVVAIGAEFLGAQRCLVQPYLQEDQDRCS